MRDMQEVELGLARLPRHLHVLANAVDRRGQGKNLDPRCPTANLDVVTGAVLNAVPRPGRPAVLSSANLPGIASDGLNGYRFMLFIDRALASTVTVEKLTVVYRN